jgi:acetyltransferase-like isoleucine patch superfamily enzyme
MSIYSPLSYVAVRLALKLFAAFEEYIERYLPYIRRCLGFEFITRLLVVAGHVDINPRIIRFFGGRVGSRARINSPLIVHNAADSFGNLAIGDNCHIGRDVMLDLANRILIGNNVTISMRCSIITHFDVGDSNLKSRGFSRKDGAVTLGDNVYLGSGVTVLHGVTIGAGSLVGAGAIVTTDIPPDSVAVGIPAKVIKSIDV